MPVTTPCDACSCPLQRRRTAPPARIWHSIPCLRPAPPTRIFLCVLCLLGVLRIVTPAAQPTSPPRYRTLNDRFTPRDYATVADWERRASYLREHILASAGLVPLPDKTPLHPHVFDPVRHRDYSVAKVYFESLPGFYVTGNLYRPEGPSASERSGAQGP